MAKFLHTENVAACQSGTSALHLSLVEAGVKPGDVVLVPPLTFIAAVNPVKYQFATPVFIDCDDSFCMDPVKLRRFCEEECRWDGIVLRYKDAVVKAGNFFVTSNAEVTFTDAVVKAASDPSIVNTAASIGSLRVRLDG